MNLEQVSEDLLKLPVPEMYLVGDVNQGMYEDVFKWLTYLRSRGSPDMLMIIDSPGGLCSWGFDIYDLLRLYGGHITGRVHNRAHSMAPVILQACAHRQATKHCAILIHSMRANGIPYEDIMSSKRIKKHQKSTKRNQYLALDILSERTGKSAKEIYSKLRKNKSMTAKQALAFGLVDEII